MMGGGGRDQEKVIENCFISLWTLLNRLTDTLNEKLSLQVIKQVLRRSTLTARNSHVIQLFCTPTQYWTNFKMYCPHP